MSYMNEFNREVILDLDEATELIAKSIMREGELRFREDLIQFLKNDLKSLEKDSISSKEKIAWLDGVKYCIYLIKNIQFD